MPRVVTTLKITNVFYTMSTPGLKEFNANNKDHVKWLTKLDGVLNETIESGRPVARMSTILANNPFGVTIPPEAFIDVHAGLCIKYASNILKGKAWVK